jgi:hypothetical protein
MPKILILDIETKPTVAYVWRAFKENISPDQVIDGGGMLCFAAKWFGEKEKFFYSEWEHGHEAMVKAAHDLLSEADAVVTFNGDKFDIPKLTGEFILNGLDPVPPLTSIDTIKTVRKLGLFMNRLAFVGPLLKVGQKVKHEGFDLWARVLNGDEAARRKMKRYNIQDVVLTEKLYRKLRPFIKNHPHLGNVGTTACGACGSHKVQSRGYRRTKSFRIQRLHCQSCGSWQDGKREKIK